ncbi:hypothetical protein LLH00_04765 [bacterium]|nr:hypothetical protein [bacterium]
MRSVRWVLLFCLLAAYGRSAAAESPAGSGIEKIVFNFHSSSLAEFEALARRAKAAGATHVDVSELPEKSWWQFPDRNDPYPQWVFINPSLFKAVIPSGLKGHLPEAPAAAYLAVLGQRCRVLRGLGLKGAFVAGEPMMLPESVFDAHPLWRGPRVDHSARSRAAQFAPAVDNPEVRALYREAMAGLIRACPEIDIFRLLTNDSGCGFDWHGGLYDGPHGNTLYASVPTGQRVAGFMKALQEGAAEGGASGVTISVQGTGWAGVRATESAEAVSSLGNAMVLENHTADGALWSAQAGYTFYFSYLYPIIGIPQHRRFVEELQAAVARRAPVLLVDIEDGCGDTYLRLFRQFFQERPQGVRGRDEFLERFAAAEAGAQNAAALAGVWDDIGESVESHAPLNMGGHIFLLGTTSQRWLNRPFVPFPTELADSEYTYYRPYLFQARALENAEDLADLQATRFVAGQGAAYIVYQYLSRAMQRIDRARGGLQEVLSNLPQGALRDSLSRLDTRLALYSLLCQGAIDAPAYQEKIDYAREKGLRPELNQRFSLDSDLFRRDILQVARQEMDNTAQIADILERAGFPLIRQTADPSRENTWEFGPDLVKQLHLKLRIMRAHWLDYDRIFTRPNL